MRMYLYADSMVIEGTRPGCCWHVIKVADGDTLNAIVTFNFWRQHRLIVIVVDPNRPRHFRLDMINQEQLLALSDT